MLNVVQNILDSMIHCFLTIIYIELTPKQKKNTDNDDIDESDDDDDNFF